MAGIFPVRDDVVEFDADTITTAADDGVITNEVWSTTLPPENIQDTDLGKVARFSDVTGIGTNWLRIGPLTSRSSVDMGIALLNLKFTDETFADYRDGSVRVILANAASFSSDHPMYYSYPDAVLSDTNYDTPATTEIDEDPDDTTVASGHTVTTPGSVTEVIYSFPDITAASTVGYDHEFRVLVEPVGATGAVTFNLILREAGVDVSTIGTGSVAADTPTVIVGRFRTSDLADQTCNDLQLRITAGASGGSCESVVRAVRWYHMYKTSSYAYDSGWKDVPTVVSGAPSNLIFEAPSLTSTSPYMWIFFDLNSSPTTERGLSVDIGRVLYGSYVLNDETNAYQKTLSMRDDTEVVRTRDGQTHAIQGPRYRRQEIEYAGLTRAQKNTLMDELRQIGHGGELCFFVEDSTGIGRYENLYGRFQDSSFQAFADDVWRSSLTLEERVSDDGGAL